MPLNDSRVVYRSPRLCVLVNGQMMTGAYQAQISSNNHYSADHFSALAALGPDPWADPDFWSSQTAFTIEIQLSLDQEESFTSVVTGMADLVSADPIRGTVHIQGRDFSAALIESQTQETFANRTSSEIAAIFALRHDLIPSVVPTSTPVGRFYESDHESLTLSQFSGATTEWDLLAYLARQEAYDLFVSGTTLFFQPIAAPTSITQTLHLSDMMEVRLERALTLARDIQVTVKSWNSAQQTAFSECTTGTLNAASDGPTLPPAQYCLVRPNLTPDRASALALQRMNELSRHERTIEFTMPGELTLTPRSVIQLDGTGTEYDQAYYISSIDRAFNTRTGFRQRVRACGSSPREVTTTVS